MLGAPAHPRNKCTRAPVRGVIKTPREVAHIARREVGRMVAAEMTHRGTRWKASRIAARAEATRIAG